MVGREIGSLKGYEQINLRAKYLANIEYHFPILVTEMLELEDQHRKQKVLHDAFASHFNIIHSLVAG